MMRSFVLALTIFALPAQAQQGVQPSGSFTPGHTVQVLNPSGTAIGDAGGSAGSALPGQNYLTELGITNTGAPLCINDALTNNPAGYHQLCLGANAFGGGVLSYNAVGGATELPLQLIVNGVTTTLPQSGSCIGCGTMAAQNADAVAISGGTITGVTITGHASLDLASANNLSDVANAATSRTNLAIAPHVATLAALQSSTTATYPSGVWRDDYSAGLGAPPLWYLPSNSACSLSSGNGDSGSQVKSADSKCWLAVFQSATRTPLEWGCVGDGVTNDHDCMQAAINATLSVPSARLVIEGKLYAVAGTLTAAATGALDIVGTFRGQGIGTWPINPATVNLCTAGIRELTINTTPLVLNGSGQAVHGVCFDSNGLNNVSGDAIEITPTSSVKQGNVIIADSQFNGFCNSIDAHGTTSPASQLVDMRITGNEFQPINNTQIVILNLDWSPFA